MAATGLLSCARGGYRVERSLSGDGVITDRLVQNEITLEGEGDYADFAIDGVQQNLVGVDQQCFLDPARRWDRYRTATYFLLFSYTGPRELFIERRRSLELVIDGYYSTKLVGQGEPARTADQMAGTYTETFEYLVPAEVLARVAQSDEVILTVTGREVTLHGFFDAKNFENFRRFVDEFVELEE